MNDITDRQHYVFLDCSPDSEEKVAEKDEIFHTGTCKYDIAEDWEVGVPANKYNQVRRPVPSQSQPTAQTDERKDRLTVWDEYAMAYTMHLGKAGWPKATAFDAKEYADEMMKVRPNEQT